MATTQSPALTQLLAQLQSEFQPTQSELLLCGFCHAPVVRSSELLRLEPASIRRLGIGDGPEAHVRLEYYRQAPGCDLVGKVIQPAGRFYGFSRQLTVCSDCHEHLGWYYQRGEDRDFFGLIEDKLVSVGASRWHRHS